MPSLISTSKPTEEVVTQPTTAIAAYEQWILCERYAEDDGLDEMLFMADLTLELAKKAGVPLEDLVPDPEHRMVIEIHAFEKSREDNWRDLIGDDSPPRYADDH